MTTQGAVTIVLYIVGVIGGIIIGYMIPRR